MSDLPHAWPGKAPTALTGLGAAAVLGILAGRPWAAGTVRTAVSDGLPATVTGAEHARVLVALALLGGAAVLAGLTSGRRLRVAAGATAVLSALGAGLVAAGVLLDPGSALAAAASARAGGLDTVAVQGSATVWPWVALLCAALLGAAGIRLVLARGWDGLGRGYEPPPPRPSRPPAREAEAASPDLWDSLTRGDDPT